MLPVSRKKDCDLSARSTLSVRSQIKILLDTKRLALLISEDKLLFKAFYEIGSDQIIINAIIYLISRANIQGKSEFRNLRIKIKTILQRDL